MSDAEDALAWQLKAVGIAFEREVRFAPPRKWRADFVIGRIIVEVDGGVWSGGRHTTGAGFMGDIEKLNAATMLGFSVIRVTPDMVDDGRALSLIETLVRGKGK